MSAPDSLDDRLQDDILARLASDSFFDTITIIEEREGTAATQVAKALAGEVAKASKFGAFLIVEMPSSKPKPEEPGPQENFELRVLVRVIPKFNNVTATGTLKGHGKIKRKVCALLHQWVIEQCAVIVEEVLPYSDSEGTVGYDITVSWQSGEEPLDLVAHVVITGTTAAVTLACSTSGAAILYTTDESPPLPSNTSASAYTVPFSISAGVAVRAAASKTGLAGSHITREQF